VHADSAGAISPDHFVVPVSVVLWVSSTTVSPLGPAWASIPPNWFQPLRLMASWGVGEVLVELFAASSPAGVRWGRTATAIAIATAAATTTAHATISANRSVRVVSGSAGGGVGAP